MTPWIQALESRMFLSASAATLAADYSAITTAASAAKSALLAVHNAEVALHSSVVDDVVLTEVKSQKAANARLYHLLTVADNTAAAKITSSENALINSAKAGAAKAVSLGKSILAHPTKTSIETSIVKEAAVLETLVPVKLASLDSVVTETLGKIDAVYSEVLIEDPSAATDIAAGESEVATAAEAYSAAIANIETTVLQLVTDFATG